MKKVLGFLVVGLLVIGMASVAGAVTVGYSENFNSYSNFNDLWDDRGNPIYYGRIGSADGPSPYYDTDLVGYPDKYVTCEDDSGLFLQIDTTGYENVEISFDWRTGSVTTGDFAQFGFFIGDISNLFTDGSTNSDVTGGFTEFYLGRSSDWKTASFSLAADTSSIWVFLGLNDGEGDFAKFDNISITGDKSAVPVPAAVWLLGSGLVGLAGLRRKFRG